MSLLQRKWVLALLATAIIVTGVGVYRWYAGRSLGVGGRRDSCAAVRHPANDGAANWIAFPDTSPQAARQLFTDAPSVSHDPDIVPSPGTPLLVHPIGMRTGVDANDCPHWLIPDYDAAGHLVEIADFIYDYPTSGCVSPTLVASCRTIPARNPFPYLSAAQATALLRQVRGVGVASDPAPELVYLPIDVGMPEQPGPAANWRGGGVTPADPVWLLAGSDGQDYIVGTELRVYTLRDLPLS